ncbi:MAG TPA: glycosyltransferase, partial [Gemmatimonadaceae bacterium]|nr:glycosyltransferase [Gemmatimonadaceae bacterium]
MPHSSPLSTARVLDLEPARPLVTAAPAFARPLRIALVTEYYYPHLGGIVEHVHFFAREARKLGHHVDIITSNIEGGAEEPNLIRVGRSQPIYANGSQARMTLGFGLEKKLRKIFARGKYD